MSTVEFISLMLFLVGVLSGFTMIGLLFYIGKTRIKAIDMAVLGYEFPHDSIFALIIRVPNYAGGFMWKWSARRGHLEGKIEHFDQKFQWPFKAIMVLMIIGAICFGVSIALDKIYGLS